MTPRALRLVRARINPSGIVLFFSSTIGLFSLLHLTLAVLGYGDPFVLLYFLCLLLTLGGALFSYWLCTLSPPVGMTAFVWLTSTPMACNFIYDAQRGHDWAHGFLFYYIGIGLLFAYTTPLHAMLYTCAVALAGVSISAVGGDIGPLVTLPLVALVEFGALLKVYDLFYAQRGLNQKLLLDNQKIAEQYQRVAAHILGDTAGDDAP